MAAALSPKQSNQQTPTFPSSDDYIRTTTQNYVSRTAHILNPSNVRIKGKTIIQPDVKIHGDYGAPIQIGRYCFIDNGVVISPTVVNSSSDPTLTPGEGAASASPGAAPSTNEKALQLTIGSSCRIGSNTKVHSLSIGSSVIIGSNCILHPRSKIYDCVVIEDWTVIPPDMIVPPYSRVKGSPGRIVGGLPECCGSEFLEGCARDYGEFVRRLEGKK